MPAYVLVQIFSAVFIGLNHPSRALMIVVGALILDTSVAAYLVPTMGLEGAAIGSVVAEVVAVLLFMLQWPSFAKEQGIKLQAATNEIVQGLAQVAAPIGVRRLMRPVQVMLLLWILGQLDSPIDLIVGTVLIKLSLLAQAPGGAFGKAAAILASRDLGGDKKRRARKRPKDALVAAMMVMGTFALLGFIFPDPVLRLFLKTDYQIEYARTAFRVVCFVDPDDDGHGRVRDHPPRDRRVAHRGVDGRAAAVRDCAPAVVARCGLHGLGRARRRGCRRGDVALPHGALDPGDLPPELDPHRGGPHRPGANRRRHVDPGATRSVGAATAPGRASSTGANASGGRSSQKRPRSRCTRAAMRSGTRIVSPS